MTSGKGIPFVDLVAPHVELQGELLGALKGVLSTGMFVGGPNVEQFEQDFARFTGAAHCVGVSSGTDALRFALIAAGVGNEDIVVTVANTFAATVEAIAQAGATAQFVDIDSRTFNMSAESLRQLVANACDRPKRAGGPCIEAAGGLSRRSCRCTFTDRCATWIRSWQSPKSMDCSCLRTPARRTAAGIFLPVTTRGKKRVQSERPRLSVSIPGKILGPAVRQVLLLPTTKTWHAGFE